MSPTLIIGAVMAALLAVSSAFGYWQYSRANTAETRLASSEAARIADQKTAMAANAQQQETIFQLQEQAKENAVELERTYNKLNEVSQANAVQRARMDKWRTRLDAETIKRPAVVARTARRAVNNFMRRVRCATDVECKPGPSGAPRADNSAPAGSGEPRSPGVRRNDADGGAAKTGGD